MSGGVDFLVAAALAFTIEIDLFLLRWVRVALACALRWDGLIMDWLGMVFMSDGVLTYETKFSCTSLQTPYYPLSHTHPNALSPQQNHPSTYLYPVKPQQPTISPIRTRSRHQPDTKPSLLPNRAVAPATFPSTTITLAICSTSVKTLHTSLQRYCFFCIPAVRDWIP